MLESIVGEGGIPGPQIEALRAAGKTDALREAVKAAKRRVLRRIEHLCEPDFRTCFAPHPDNAPILAMPE